jgi:hypothetical protein
MTHLEGTFSAGECTPWQLHRYFSSLAITQKSIHRRLKCRRQNCDQQDGIIANGKTDIFDEWTIVMDFLESITFGRLDKIVFAIC